MTSASDLAKIINHLRNRTYMSGVERDKQRIKSSGEVFTPTALVQEMLDKLPPELFTDPTKTFLDPTCGDGQFLAEVIIRKIENGSTYAQALSTVYGADLKEDNCIECIKRLYGAIHSIQSDEIKVLNGSRGHKIPKDSRQDWQRAGVKAVFSLDGKPCNIVCANGLEYDYSFGEPLTKAEIKANRAPIKKTSSQKKTTPPH